MQAELFLRSKLTTLECPSAHVIELVCCRMTPLQRSVYEHFTSSEAARRMLRAADGGKSKQAPRVRCCLLLACHLLFAHLLPAHTQFSSLQGDGMISGNAPSHQHDTRVSVNLE